MNNFIDLAAEKQKILQTFEQLEFEMANYQQQIASLKLENEALKQQTNNQLQVVTDTTERRLDSELDLLKHQNNELEHLLATTKQRISELSNILIDKESQIKELKANQPKRTNRFDIAESDQLFEAKMAVTEKDKQIRQLEIKLAKLQSLDNAEKLISDKDHQIQLLTTAIDNLETTNVKLIFENEELKTELEQLTPTEQHLDQEQTSIPGTETSELQEIDSLLEHIIDHQLNVDKLNEEQTITNLESEFEFTAKAKLALKLLLNDGLDRNSFKRALMAHHEIIDSFIGEVNGYFEDQYFFELISENKNYYTINQELFE